MPGSAYVIAETVVKREIRLDAPTILGKKTKVKTSSVGRIRLSLDEGTGRTQEKIDKVATSFRSSAVQASPEEEVTVSDVGKVFFILVVVILGAKFHRVSADNFAEIVEHLVDVFDQLVRPARHANSKVIEVDFRNPFDTRCSDMNPRSAVVPRSKS